LEFKEIRSLPSCHIYEKDAIKVLIPIYVDDKVLACSHRTFADYLIKELQKVHKLRHLGELKTILGIKVERDRSKGTIILSQTAYVDKILKVFNMENCKEVATPLNEGTKLSIKDGPKTNKERLEVKNIPYLSAIGSLIFIAQVTRPDIAFAAGYLGRFSSNFGMDHWRAVKHVFRYLKGTRDMKLEIGGRANGGLGILNLRGFSDAANGDSLDDGRSTSGYATFIGNHGPIAWNSKNSQLWHNQQWWLN
jgi:Reverse transcriptase (RNA-dependent DNA polymerase)